MLSRFLPAPLVGLIGLILITLDTILVPLIILIATAFMYLIPIPWWRRKCAYFTHEIAPGWWAAIGKKILALTIRTEWDVQGRGELNRTGWYILICNHRSWLDILVLQNTFHNRLPMLKYFMKRSLLWLLPVAAWACWAMGFPFVQRHSKEYIKKHPEKAKYDLEVTQRACEKFKNQPITIVNYLEGARFRQAKWEEQESPYKNLLKPKTGGLSFIIDAMQKHLTAIINVTLIYPDPNTSMWNFLCGRVKKIIVRYDVVPIPPHMVGDYGKDLEFRHRFQHWVNQLWHEKDALITGLLEKENK